MNESEAIVEDTKDSIVEEPSQELKTSELECAECKREITDSSRVREVRDQEGNLKNLCKDCYKKIIKQKEHHIPKGSKTGVKLTPKVELKRMCEKTEIDVIKNLDRFQPGWREGEEINPETMKNLRYQYIRADKSSEAFAVCKGEREMQRVIRAIRIRKGWKLPARGQKKNISKPKEIPHITPKILQIVEERTNDMVDYKELVISATQGMIYKKTKDDVLAVINDLFEAHFGWSVIQKTITQESTVSENITEQPITPEQPVSAESTEQLVSARSTDTTSMSSTSTEPETNPEEMMG